MFLGPQEASTVPDSNHHLSFPIPIPMDWVSSELQPWTHPKSSPQKMVPRYTGVEDGAQMLLLLAGCYRFVDLSSRTEIDDSN